MWPHKEADNLGNEHPQFPQGRRLPEGNVREVLIEIVKMLKRLETKLHLVGEAVGANMQKRPEKPVEQG